MALDRSDDSAQLHRGVVNETFRLLSLPLQHLMT